MPLWDYSTYKMGVLNYTEMEYISDKQLDISYILNVGCNAIETDPFKINRED